MKNSNKDKADENQISIRDFLVICLSQWKWYVISVICFVAIGMLYVMRQQPVYTRTMSVLIQNDESSSALSVSKAFKDFGFGGSNTNVYNELISLKSPAVMFEVVKRLNLNVSITEKKLPHGISLYKTSSPLTVECENIAEIRYSVVKMELQPDDTYEMNFFGYSDANGKYRKIKDKVIKGKLGNNVVKTPVGSFILRNTIGYDEVREDPMTLIFAVNSIKGAVESYLPRLKADLADSDADVIDLTFDDVNVTRATDILETVVDVYNEFWVRDKNSMAVATSQFIDDRLNSLIHELGEVDSDIADYQSQNKIADPEAAQRSIIEEGAFVNREALESANRLAMAKYVRDYVANPANASSIVPVNTGGINNSLEMMIKEYNTMLINRENLLANSGENNPVIAKYDTELKGMRESLLKSLNSQVGQLEANLASIETARKANENLISQAPERAKFLGTIKRDQAVKESLYLFLLEKREENNLSRAFNAYNTRIITPPYGPSAPISPKKGSTMIACIVLGLMVPMVAMYFVYACDTKVRSRSDLENLAIPYTGEIPQVGRRKKLLHLLQSKKKRQTEIDKPKPIVMEGKRDVPNEAFRVVRSNIDLMLGRNAEHPVLMVTSFNPGSGKSFVAYNLCASFALKRKKVLLIDGDLRHGSTSTYVNSPHKGLASYLTGATTDPSKIIYPVEDMTGLSIIPIGKRPPNPAELLENGRFGELLEAVKNEYDVIMVDCPPVNVVVDTQLLNKYADATIFVVRAGLLEKSAVKDITKLYEDGKLKRMSILLNGTEATHSSYYTYGNYQSLEN